MVIFSPGNFLLLISTQLKHVRFKLVPQKVSNKYQITRLLLLPLAQETIRKVLFIKSNCVILRSHLTEVLALQVLIKNAFSVYHADVETWV